MCGLMRKCFSGQSKGSRIKKEKLSTDEVLVKSHPGLIHRVL